MRDCHLAGLFRRNSAFCDLPCEPTVTLLLLVELRNSTAVSRAGPSGSEAMGQKRTFIWAEVSWFPKILWAMPRLSVAILCRKSQSTSNPIPRQKRENSSFMLCFTFFWIVVSFSSPWRHTRGDIHLSNGGSLHQGKDTHALQWLWFSLNVRDIQTTSSDAQSLFCNAYSDI